MNRRALVVRPEPGNSRTAERLRQAGWQAIQLPLFAVRPVAWEPPNPAAFDALLLTSANAVRHAGAGLDRLKHLPVAAVGETTAAAARRVGLDVRLVGSREAEALVDEAASLGRLLHLAGRDRVAVPGIDAITVYASDDLSVAPDQIAGLGGGTVLLHSPRAARRFASLADRAEWTLAALSAAVGMAAGEGWRQTVVASVPTDEALLAALPAH